MKVYSYRGTPCVLVPDAPQNTHDNAVIRKIANSPDDPKKFIVLQGQTELAFRHELKDTGQEAIL